MKYFKIFLPIIFALILSPFNFLNSQELSGKYLAKTITYYPNAVPVGEIPKPPAEYNRKYLASLLEKQIKLPRFYWESLPDEITSNFTNIYTGKEYKSVNELNQDVEEYIAPEIIKILDINKEIRALSLLTEAERNSFIATKAKSLGIPAEKVERVMNSGYVVIPFISQYLASKDTVIMLIKPKDKKEEKVRVPIIRVYLKGGLTFFKVNFQNNRYFVKPEVMIEEEARSAFEIKDGNVTAAEDSAFKKASNDLVFSFELAVREIFKLSAQISEAGFNTVSFPLGKREGIGIDDGFDVIEFVEQPDGSIRPKNVGFVRVIKVADNTKRNEFSKAQIIIGGIFAGRIASGMIVEERPRFPFDGVIGGLLSPVKIQTGKFKLNEQGVSNDTIEISSHGKFAYTVQFNINSNYGRLSNSQISQLWITFGGSIGFIPIEAKFFGEDVKSALFGSLNFGLMKKFYFRRLALAFEVDMNYSNFEFSIKKDTVKYAVSPAKWFWGASAGAGVEFVINPDVNMGAKAFYQITSKSNEWSFLRKAGEDEKRRKIKFSSVDLSGLMFQFYINISFKNVAKVRKLG